MLHCDIIIIIIICLTEQFIHDQIPQLSHYFPVYYGECGHTIIQEHETYRPLKTFLPEEWLVRVDLALQILQMVEDFRTASPDWMLVFGNITYDNLAVTKEGRIKVVNLQDVMVVDKAEINQSKFQQFEFSVVVVVVFPLSCKHFIH